MNRTARFPTTRNRTRAEEVAKSSTRKSIVGKLVGRVEEVTPGNFAVLVTCDGKPYGAMPL
jgi:hypothetical protein